MVAEWKMTRHEFWRGFDKCYESIYLGLALVDSGMQELTFVVSGIVF